MLQNDFSQKNQWFFFKSFYKAIVGDSDDFDEFADSSPELEDLIFFIFFIFTIFFIVVMLNMLIAIISETFNKVTALESKAFLYERLNIIVEYEEIMDEVEIRKLKNESENQLIYFAQIQDSLQEDMKRQKEEENLAKTKINEILSELQYLKKDRSSLLQERTLIKESL